MSENYRILEYSGENFKRLRLVHFKPKGRMTVFTGKNDQGKTSILDSVPYVFGGAKAAPEMPLRKGAAKLDVTLDLGRLTVSRSASRLTVTPAKGETAWDTPQAMLDSIYEELAFNPQQFAQLQAEAQAEILRATLGLEDQLKALDEANERDFERRKQANAEAKRLGTEAAAIPAQEGLPAAKIDEDEIRERLRAANAHNQALAQLVVERHRCEEALTTAEQAEQRHTQLITDKAAEISRLETEDSQCRAAREWIRKVGETLEQRVVATIGDYPKEWTQDFQFHLGQAMRAADAMAKEKKARAADIVREIKTARQALQAAQNTEQSVHDAVAEARVALENNAPADVINTAALLEELERAQLANREIAKRVRREILEAQAAAERTESQALTRAMEDREEEKRRLYSEAKMPIDGLTLGEKQVLFGGIPVKQLGEAKQIMLGVSIAIARNPKLRLVLIPHGEALDEDTFADLARMAEEKDFYVWVAKVDSSGKVGIYIEDGMIKAENE
jgi:hypothetical protein